MKVPEAQTLVLRELNDSEKVLCWTRTAVSWAGPLNLNDYCQRSRVESGIPKAENQGHRYWGLVEPDSQSTVGEGNVNIYSAVEALRTTMLVQKANGQVRHEQTWGIAGVYTPEKYRNQGFATQMMHELAKWLDSPEANCNFSFLYSAVKVKLHAFDISINADMHRTFTQGLVGSNISHERSSYLPSDPLQRARFKLSILRKTCFPIYAMPTARLSSR